MVVLSLEKFTNLPVYPVDQCTLAFHSCYNLCYLKNCLLRDLGGRLPLESCSYVPEPFEYMLL